MEIGENCRDLKAELGKATENLCDLGIPCHICHHIFEKGQEIYVHKIESLVFRGYRNTFPVCHKKCRVVEPEPTVEPESMAETSKQSNQFIPDVTESIHYEIIDGKKTYYGNPLWSPDDDLKLEEMWKNEESGEEIARTLDRTIGAIHLRIKRKKIEKKTGRKIKEEKVGWKNKRVQLNWLDRLGYNDREPISEKHAWQKIDNYLFDLRVTGYNGPAPKTNEERVKLRYVLLSILASEKQIREIKQIREALGITIVAELPTTKKDANKMIEHLLEKAKKSGIHIPPLQRKKSIPWWKRTNKPDDEDGEEEEEEEDELYDEWYEELGSHETDDDIRGD